MIDINEFVDNVKKIIANHEMKVPGAYCRWLREKQEQEKNLLPNPYGCADAANILYTLGDFPKGSEERLSWIAVLNSLQSPESGLFFEKTHHEIHTTAHCIAALELFDSLPKYQLKAFEPYKTTEGLIEFLEDLDWRSNPWNASHQGAGLYAALVLSEEVGVAWQKAYFKWLYENADPATGFMRKGFIDCKTSDKEIFPHLAGSFHYFFNMEYAHEPIRYPEKVIDTCLDIYYSKAYPLGAAIGFAEIDWVYCLSRALQQCHFRFDESMEVLMAFTEKFIKYLQSLNPAKDEMLNDLHALFGTICCLAELQRVLPGVIITDKPMKLVLDRRPFI